MTYWDDRFLLSLMLTVIGMFLVTTVLIFHSITDPSKIGTASNIPWSLIGIAFIMIGLFGMVMFREKKK